MRTAEDKNRTIFIGTLDASCSWSERCMRGVQTYCVSEACACTHSIVCINTRYWIQASMNSWLHNYRHGQHVMIQLKDLVSPWPFTCALVTESVLKPFSTCLDVLRGTYKGHIAGHSTRNGPWLWHSASIYTCIRIWCAATNQLLMPADIATFAKATAMYVRIIQQHRKDNGRMGPWLWMWMNVSINSTIHGQ